MGLQEPLGYMANTTDLSTDSHQRHCDIIIYVQDNVLLFSYVVGRTVTYNMIKIHDNIPTTKEVVGALVKHQCLENWKFSSQLLVATVLQSPLIHVSACTYRSVHGAGETPLSLQPSNFGELLLTWSLLRSFPSRQNFLKDLQLNFNSLKSEAKKAELSVLLTQYNLDVVIGCESKLDNR